MALSVKNLTHAASQWSGGLRLREEVRRVFGSLVLVKFAITPPDFRPDFHRGCFVAKSGLKSGGENRVGGPIFHPIFHPILAQQKPRIPNIGGAQIADVRKE